MDWRIIVVLLPIILAGSWAIFKILTPALSQIQAWWNKQA